MHGPRNTYFCMSIWNMKHRINVDMSFVMLLLKLLYLFLEISVSI